MNLGLLGSGELIAERGPVLPSYYVRSGWAVRKLGSCRAGSKADGPWSGMCLLGRLDRVNGGPACGRVRRKGDELGVSTFKVGRDHGCAANKVMPSESNPHGP
ncbi:hypothetical protein V6N13_099752 [Hibiscus sabdariffa]|uniref:Uncharacterized protein n=1 Tax=Hibiscus sabdariffa TaxID=183260 RepID=A0ABR2NMJ6_9ROSI